MAFTATLPAVGRLMQATRSAAWTSRPAAQLSKTYREGKAEHAVLRDVSLTIASGEIVVPIGG